ncbi:MAG: YfhO family protein [Myxococcales bacterium]|nr:YfhO family protein [Myxococcales bacterium]
MVRAAPRGAAAWEPCAVLHWRPGDVALRCRATAPAVAALAVAWDPGWSVRVGAKASPVLRVEGALLGVAVSAGEHEVRWRYAPRGGAAGAAVSALAFLALAAVASWCGRRWWRRRATTRG